MEKELLTVQEFCKSANVGLTNAYKFLNRGEIKAVKLGKKTLIPRAEITRWIEGLQPYTSNKSLGE